MAFALVLAVVSIAGRDLSGHDDPRVAGIAREMALTGNLAVPHLNGRPFLEYPSLGYLPYAVAFLPFREPPDFAGLLPAALLGVATVFLTVRIGRLLGGPALGCAAGYILATVAGFRHIHTRCLVDAPLLFFVTLSLYGVIAGAEARRRSFLWFSLAYAAAGAGFLVKGLIGVAIPASVVGVWVLLRRDYDLLRRLRPLLALPVTAVPVALWALAAWHTGGPAVVREVFRQSVWRFAASQEDVPHGEPVWGYLLPFPGLTLPALLLILASLVVAFVRPRIRAAGPGAAARFPAVWLAVTFVGLSVATAKRLLYLAPLYPAVGLLAAACWVNLAEVWPRLRRFAAPALALYAAGFAIIHFAILLPEENSTSMRGAFAVARANMEGREVLLYGKKESLRGAGVFYIGKVCPEAPKTADLRSYLAEHLGPLVIVAVWDRDKGAFSGEPPPPGLRLIHDEPLKGRFTLQVYLR